MPSNQYFWLLRQLTLIVCMAIQFGTEKNVTLHVQEKYGLSFPKKPTTKV